MPNGFWRGVGDVLVVFLLAVVVAWVAEANGYGTWGRNFLWLAVVGLSMAALARFRDRLKPSVVLIWKYSRLYILGALGYLVARSVLGYIVGMPLIEFNALTIAFELVYQRGLIDPIAQAAVLVDLSILGYVALVAAGILPGRKWAAWIAEKGFIVSIAIGTLWAMQMAFAPSAAEDLRRWPGETMKLVIPTFPVTDAERNFLEGVRADRDRQQLASKQALVGLKTTAKTRELNPAERGEQISALETVRRIDSEFGQKVEKYLARDSAIKTWLAGWMVLWVLFIAAIAIYALGRAYKVAWVGRAVLLAVVAIGALLLFQYGGWEKAKGWLAMTDARVCPEAPEKCPVCQGVYTLDFSSTENEKLEKTRLVCWQTVVIPTTRPYYRWRLSKPAWLWLDGRGLFLDEPGKYIVGAGPTRSLRFMAHHEEGEIWVKIGTSRAEIEQTPSKLALSRR